MTFNLLNRILAVVEVHVCAKSPKAKSSGLEITVLTKKQTKDIATVLKTVAYCRRKSRTVIISANRW